MSCEEKASEYIDYEVAAVQHYLENHTSCPGSGSYSTLSPLLLPVCKIAYYAVMYVQENAVHLWYVICIATCTCKIHVCRVHVHLQQHKYHICRFEVLYSLIQGFSIENVYVHVKVS